MSQRTTTYAIVTIFMFAFTAMSHSAVAQNVIDRVIAKVGGEYITHSEVNRAFNYAREQNPGMEESNKCFLMEQIIAQKILVNEAKLDSIEVPSGDVESQLDYRMGNIMGMLNGDEEQFELRYGKTVLQAKSDMRTELKQQMLAEKIQQKLISQVSITPKEVVKFYNNIPVDSLPYFSSEVELGELVLKPQVNEEEAEKARVKLEGVRQQILDGTLTFEEAAAKYSMDGSAQQGGDLGMQKRGTFVGEFEATAYNLEIGEMSEVIETEFGYHIIRLDDRRGNLIKARHVLIVPEITQADLDLTKENLERFKSLIESDSLYFEAAVKLFSYKEMPSYNNNGRMQNPNTGDNFFETGDLSPDMYFAIEEMEVGELSNPLEFAGQRGEVMFRLIKLVSRTRPHKASLDQDYSRIQNFAKQSKKSEYFNDWMLEKLRNTYISMDAQYESCPNLIEFLNQ